MNHYKSWSGLNKQLSDFLCEPLKDRITYFLTRYHDVHNAYGRAAVLLDKKELVCFTWTEGYEQEYGFSRLHENGIKWSNMKEILKPEWDKNCTYSEMDFLSAATKFLQMPISDALYSDNYIIRIFAILDKRVGKRTLQAIKSEGAYIALPEWINQFYKLRFSVSNC